MKAIRLSILLMLCLSAAGIMNAQNTYTQNPHCTGLKNPTNFTFTGGLANALWKGHTGTKNAQVSTCTSLGSTFNTTIQASDLANTTGGSSCYGSSSVNYNGQPDATKRFVIKGAGYDPETNNTLPYQPPADTSFHTSIRLGNFCGGTEAEMISYEYDVTADNSLVTIWYALSLYNALHDAANNPEFLILIERQLPNGNWVPAGGDTLCYIQQTPTSSNNLGVFSSVNSNNVFLNWTKVIVDLGRLQYQRVRIKLATGDCAYTAHYGLCYFAGECQAMTLKANGCAAGETETVATIEAPKGAAAYRWYRSKHGRIDEGQDDTTKYVHIPGETSYILNATTSQFEDVTTHATMVENTFMCRMTTYMNPQKPVVSPIFTNVGNTKPTLVVDSVFGCNADITLRDLSFSPYISNDSEMVDTTQTRWYFYNSATPTAATLVDSVIGPSASHIFNNAGNYCVRVRTSTYDPSCWNEKIVNFRTYKQPIPRVALDRNNICEGDAIIMTDLTQGSGYHRWITPDTDFVSPTAVTRLIFDTTTDVTLVTRNSTYFMSDTTGDGITEETHCYVDTTFRIFVEKYPELKVIGDTIVCNGDQSDVQVLSTVDGCTFNWYQVYEGTAPFVENNSHLVTNITQDRTYYVKATSTFGCESWDSIKLYLVKPDLHSNKERICVGDSVTLTAGRAAYFEWTSNPPDPRLNAQSTEPEIVVTPEVTTVYSVVGHGTNGCSATPLTQKITVFPWPIQHVQLTPDYIDSENPSVQFADLSEYGTTSLWNFGNGNTSTLRTVVFSFTDLSQDSIQISLTTGNELGCSHDTSFYVPVGIFAVWFPNAFTPNLETNNTFKPFTANDLLDYELFIYDRGGTLVFHTNDIEASWDGTYRGYECKPGTYVYIAKYRRKGVERLMSQKGTVTIIK